MCPFLFYYVLFRVYYLQRCLLGKFALIIRAATSQERQKGLMFRDRLDAGKAMLFVFETKGEHPFWMKNMKFGLDIIWIDDDMNIVHISKKVLPCGNDCNIFSPKKKTRYVLEVPYGFAQENNIEVGDKVEFCF